MRINLTCYDRDEYSSDRCSELDATFDDAEDAIRYMAENDHNGHLMCIYSVEVEE